MTSIDPRVRRVRLAIARMKEGVAEARRFLAAGQEDEAEEALLSMFKSVRRELDGEGGAR